MLSIFQIYHFFKSIQFKLTLKVIIKNNCACEPFAERKKITSGYLEIYICISNSLYKI